MLKIDTSIETVDEIEKSMVINNKSIIHLGLLNELNIQADLREKVYFRYNQERKLIHTLYITPRFNVHIHIGTRRLGKGYEKGLETERNHAPYTVLIDSPLWFFRYENEFCKYSFSQ